MIKNLTLLGCLAFASLAYAEDVHDFDLSVVEELGQAIYQQDKIAAEATDILFSQGLDLSKYPIRGWVVTESKKESTVTFIGVYDAEPRGIFEISKKRKKKAVFKELKGEEQALNEYQLSSFRARSLALESITEPCSDRYNFVVLDDLDHTGFLVYALAATTDPDAVLVGGHYRFTISENGNTLEMSERLSGSCLVLDKTPSDMPPGASLAALSMTHIVSERPLETHVFLNLLHNMDFYVGTKDQSVWKIHNGKLQKIN